jgi:putative iron-only hydrogenase system regulator
MEPIPENRLAVIGIFVERSDATDRLNAILHDHADCIVGRMGIPYRTRNLGVITLILDAPESAVSALAGKLGMVDGIRVKTMFAKTEA